MPGYSFLRVYSDDCRNCNRCPNDENGIPMILTPQGCQKDCA